MRFLSVPHARANQTRLARALGCDDYPEAVSKLRRIASSQDSSIGVSFAGSAFHSSVVRTGVFDDVFTDTYDLSTTAQRQVEELVAGALNFVHGVDAKLAELIRLIVTDVVVFPSRTRKGGGSASHMPGVVAVSPTSEWSVADMAETLVHEATHLNVFLSEMLHKLYTRSLDELAKPEYRALSAVRIGEMRPLDKAFHSALVAVPLLYMQGRTNRDSLATLFSASLIDSCNGIIEKRDCFTDYGWRMAQDLARYTASHTNEGFSDRIVEDGLRASDESCLER